MAISRAAQGALVLFAYCSLTMFMVLCNRHLVLRVSTAWNLVFLQCSASSLCFSLVLLLARDSPRVHRTTETTCGLFASGILFTAMLYSNLQAMSLLSIPSYIICKNYTTIFNAWMQRQFNLKDAQHANVFSVMLMAVGSTLALALDATVVSRGVVWVILNVLLHVIFSLYSEKLQYSGKVCPLFLAWSNSTVAIVCVWAGFLMTHASLLESLRRDFFTLHFFDMVVLILSSFLGICLGPIQTLCVSLTTISHVAVTTSLNKIPTSIVGAVIFDTELAFLVWIFVFVALSGDLLYHVDVSTLLRASSESTWDYDMVTNAEE